MFAVPCDGVVHLHLQGILVGTASANPMPGGTHGASPLALTTVILPYAPKLGDSEPERRWLSE